MNVAARHRGTSGKHRAAMYPRRNVRVKLKTKNKAQKQHGTSCTLDLHWLRVVLFDVIDSAKGGGLTFRV